MVERLCVCLGVSLTLCMCMVKRRCMVKSRGRWDGNGLQRRDDVNKLKPRLC